MSDREERDLPQPGDDPVAEDRDVERDDPTSGPGNVSVDEPTETSLDPDAEHENWGESSGGGDVTSNTGTDAGATGDDADAATS